MSEAPHERGLQNPNSLSANGRNTSMVSANDEPADLAAFRARREELKRQRRRQKARYDFTVMARTTAGRSRRG